MISGGRNATGPLARSERYDETSGTWSATDTLGTARSLHTATLLASGTVLVAGGAGSTGSLASTELFDELFWTPTGLLASLRQYHTATLLSSGKVLVAGGFDRQRYIGLATAELYDEVTGTWTPPA